MMLKVLYLRRKAHRRRAAEDTTARGVEGHGTHAVVLGLGEVYGNRALALELEEGYGTQAVVSELKEGEVDGVRNADRLEERGGGPDIGYDDLRTRV